MKRREAPHATLVLAVLVGAVTAASAQDATDRARGVAAAAVVMAPVNFRQGCEGSAADATARLHCAIRVLAVEGGANFMYRMRLDEIATGRQRKVETLLQVKQYGEKIYDACLAQHGDEIEKDGSFAVPDSICKLEKADAYTGMQLFNNAVGASK